MLKVGQTTVSLEAWPLAALLGIVWPTQTRISGHGRGFWVPSYPQGNGLMLELPPVFMLVGKHHAIFVC